MTLSRPVLLLLALSAAACDRTPIDDPQGGSAELKRFESCDALRDYVTDVYTETLVQSRYSYGYMMEDAAASDGSSESDGPSDYSTTNVQELGVDEPDLVKTDGNFIYIVQDDELHILQSWPAEDTAEVGSLSLPGWSESMFLKGDRLVVFSYDYDDRTFDDEYGYNYVTVASIIDVSDRAAPELLRELRLEGWMASARMIEDDVYMVQRSWTNMPYSLWELAWDESLGLPEMDWEASEEELAQMRAQARGTFRPLVEQQVWAMDLDELLPRYADSLPGEQPQAQALVSCTDIYHPEELSNPSSLSVVHFALEEGDAGSDVSATSLMADGWTVYASQDNLYVAQTSWWWWWGWGDTDPETRIHRFALDGADTIYEASGSVDGWLLNQWSMSEYDGHLRVATTDLTWWWWWGAQEETEDPPANNIFVLEQTATDMDVVGEIGGIAPNEQIFTARFMGEVGYLVTFERVDPLFTLDLADPTAPRVVGELEVPGFSSYLHPLEDGYLLSVGMDGDENGNISGLSVSIFDVSDFANPRLAHRYTLESDDWSWSESLWNHHAFTLHRGVLSLPVYTWTWDELDGSYEGFSGMLVLDVDAQAGLTELGRVDHADLVRDSECRYGNYGRGCSQEEWYWYAWMRRSVVIEDNLFSISDYGVKVSDLNDPSIQHARVLFNPYSGR